MLDLNLSLPESVAETFNLVLTFESVDEILWRHIQMKPLQQYFHVVPLIFKYYLQNEIWDSS